MWIPIFAAAGALCAIPTRTLARRLINNRTEEQSTSRILYGRLSLGLWMGICTLAWSLIAAMTQEAGMVRLIQSVLVFQIILCLSAVDIVIRRIPNELLLALLLAYAAGHTVSPGWSGFTSNLLGAAVAAAVFMLPSKLGMIIGWGDVKYAVVIGFCFGLTGILQVMLVMGLSLGVYTAYLYLSRRGSVKSTAAMGPYISLGAMATMVFPVYHTIF